MSSLDFTFTPEALAQAEAATVNPYLADPKQGLALVTRLIAHPPAAPAAGQRAHLARLHQLIHERFVSLAARDDHPGAVLAHRKLLALEASLQDLVSFPDLANKSIVGVGGGFSAGKSRFLNTLLGQPLLPEDTTPTTAIPTFLTRGTAPSTVALNTFNHQVPLDAPALAAITHAFRKHYLQTAGEEVGFAHVLKLLMLRTPAFAWRNLAFLDTPGYSKADGEGTHTDERLALQQLAEADRLVWLINAKNGSIREDDIAFLRTLKHAEPVFVVLTQADLISHSSIDAVMASTREALAHAGIACAGLMAWAAPLRARQGERMAGDNVLAWLATLDQTPKFTTKRRDCAQVLDAYIHHSDNALKHNKALLAALNELLLIAKELPSNRQQAVRDEVERSRNEQKRLNELVGEFKTLKTELLAEVGAIVGEVAVDQEVRDDRRLLHTLQTKVLRGSVAVGTQFTATVQNGEHVSYQKPMLELKHQGEQIIAMKTRGQLTASAFHDKPLILAKGSVSPPIKRTDDMSADDLKAQQNRYMVDLYLNREYDTRTEIRPFVSLRDQMVHSRDVIRLTRSVRLNLEFDFKRKPINPTLRSVGESVHLAFDTEPWQTANEVDEVRDIFDNGWRKNHTLKTLEDWTNWQDFHASKITINKSRKNGKTRTNLTEKGSCGWLSKCA